jgi:hypothetical protein
MTDEVKEVPTDLEESVEAMFDKFISEYEMDASGSIEDMLYEFYSEGFINALETLEGGG